MKSLIASKLMDFNEIVFIEKNVNSEIQASSLRNKQKKNEEIKRHVKKSRVQEFLKPNTTS